MNIFKNNLHIFLTAIVVVVVVVGGSFYIVQSQSSYSRLSDSLYVPKKGDIRGGLTLGTGQSKDFSSLLVPVGRVGIRVNLPSVALDVIGGIKSDDITSDSITSDSITSSSTIVEKIQIVPSTNIENATSSFVIVSGSTCPSGFKLAKKYRSATCYGNDSCNGVCTTSDDWIDGSSSAVPTCTYVKARYTTENEFIDCGGSLTCTANTVNAVLCITNS